MGTLRTLLLATLVASLPLVGGCSLLKDFDFEVSTCAPGETDCDGTCRDLTNDRLACGSCTNACPGAESFCQESACQLVDGANGSQQFYTTSAATTPIPAVSSAADRGVYYGTFHSSQLSLQETPAQVLADAANTEANFGKYAANGNLNWANGINGAASELIYSVAATPDGPVAGGYFTTVAAQSGANFTDSMGIIQNHSANVAGGMGYVWAVNPDGTHRWWQDVRGSNYARVYQVRSDSMGNVYVAGVYSGTLQIAGSTDLSGGVTLGAFVARLRPNGARDWVVVIEDADLGILEAMTVDSTGRVYLFSTNESTVTIDGDTFTAAFTPMIIAVEASGVVWWEHYDSAEPSEEGGAGVAVTSDGRLYILFHPDSDSSAIGDILLARGATIVELDSNDGTPLGDVPIVNNDMLDLRTLDVDGFDNLVTAGWVVGMEFDLGGGVITKPDAGADALIASYTPNGDYRYAHFFGTTLTDIVSQVAVHPSGRVTAVGSFNEAVTWGNVMLTPGGGAGADTYLVAFDPTPVPAP